MIFSLDELQVQCIGDDQFIAHNATVIGAVTLNELVSVWYNVVIRGDAEKISIGARSNIQDGSVLHADPGFPLEIGEDVTVGHKAMLHGCTVGDGSLIGINAVVLNGAKIGKGCLIGANALVTEGTEIPDGSMVLGAPAKIKRSLSDDEQAALKLSAAHYVENGQRFRKGLKAEP
ncbi:MAG: carbonic anhydrase/acetyltransferase-like protein (isoleucine patch superfamily) [Bermanella sp.]|jgi:carbonic anhydrase/acetyltransferase-like protein (isoleucine patch superfamily)